MRCLIKNVPPLSFSIVGNRGVGFPLLERVSLLPQPPSDVECYLAKEDGFTAIQTDQQTNILVDCVDPTDVCVLVLQEDRDVYLSQEDGTELFCNNFTPI